MKMTACRFHRYRLPLARPIVVGNVTSTHREGLIITLQNASGRIGCGEIAPLPGLHAENLDDIIVQLSAVKDRVTTIDWSINEPTQPSQCDEALQGLMPSVRCGLEMALMNLSANDMSNADIAICGLVTADTDACEQARRLSAAGYTTVKIKVGRTDLDRDTDTIGRIRGEVADRMQLRLDANRAWTLDEALRFCRQVGPEAIEYIEEPVADPADHKAFIREAGMPMALDETLTGIEPSELAIPDGVAAVILKPSTLGGLSRTTRWIDAAGKRDIRAVLSSCFETALAVRTYAAMAVRMGLTDIAQGLDTLKFLREDVASAPVVRNGRMSIGPFRVRHELLEEIIV